MFEPKTDMTIVVGIDAKTIRQFEVSHPTWRRFRPEMWSMPWVVFYDRDQLEYHPLKAWFRQLDLSPELVPWPPPAYAVPYASQREKMLSGHIHVPAGWVQTQWHAKIDTDVVATRTDNWLKPEWFMPASHSHADELPAYIAPRWHYTKGVGYLDMLDQWANDLPQFSGHAAMPIERKPGQLRVGHSRMCSWVSYYQAAFTRHVAVLCRQGCGEWRLPVPSQDTVAWYVAARLGFHHLIANQKAVGWNNHSRFDELQRVVAEIMSNDVRRPAAESGR
jgi:hypothetical protein